jgi:hypothetical protein
VIVAQTMESRFGLESSAILSALFDSSMAAVSRLPLR